MMTEAKIELVKNSWGRVVAYSEKAGRIFYERLFELAPELRTLFKDDVQTQNQKLILAVTVIITKLNKLENLELEIQKLAKKHQAFGIAGDHFVMFKLAFVEMLRAISQTLWDEETEEAWKELFDLISVAMLNQMNEQNYTIHQSKKDE